MIFNNQQYYNCEIILNTDNTYQVAANWIHNNQLDNWYGWECDAGHNRLVIDADLTIYSGECLNDNLGNIKTGWSLLTAPTTCQQIRCTGCTDDLLQHKREIK